MSRTDDTPSIDLAVTFFACVLVMFVFVTFLAAPRPEPETTPTTGQKTRAADSLPSSWDAVRERTSFALLSAQTLTLLEGRHFAQSFLSPSNWVQSAGHLESAVARAGEPSPNAFRLVLTTTGSDLPPGWVRHAVRLDDAGARSAESCAAMRSAQPPGMSDAHLTVLLDVRRDVSLEPFLQFARLCAIRYRLVMLPKPKEAGGALVINLGLDRTQYSLETLFR